MISLPPLVLASSSPRRIGFLRTLGLEFEAIAPDVDERVPPGIKASDLVLNLALSKVEAGRVLRPAACVLGADTTVSIGGEIMGKPRDVDEAGDMLSRLSGKAHNVHTGLAIMRPDGTAITEVVRTVVRMRVLSRPEIAAYLATGESMDKAGAYGIQGHGAHLIQSISGCFTNVAGLPLCRLTGHLTDLGLFTGALVVCGEGPDSPPVSLTGRAPL